jgi:hypothetical protein
VTEVIALEWLAESLKYWENCDGYNWSSWKMPWGLAVRSNFWTFLFLFLLWESSGSLMSRINVHKKKNWESCDKLQLSWFLWPFPEWSFRLWLQNVSWAIYSYSSSFSWVSFCRCWAWNSVRFHNIISF